MYIVHYLNWRCATASCYLMNQHKYNVNSRVIKEWFAFHAWQCSSSISKQKVWFPEIYSKMSSTKFLPICSDLKWTLFQHFMSFPKKQEPRANSLFRLQMPWSKQCWAISRQGPTYKVIHIKKFFYIYNQHTYVQYNFQI